VNSWVAGADDRGKRGSGSGALPTSSRASKIRSWSSNHALDMRIQRPMGMTNISTGASSQLGAREQCDKAPARSGLGALIARCCETKLSLLKRGPSYRERRMGGRNGTRPSCVVSSWMRASIECGTRSNRATSELSRGNHDRRRAGAKLAGGSHAA
jgi:hypothetical protein